MNRVQRRVHRAAWMVLPLIVLGVVVVAVLTRSA